MGRTLIHRILFSTIQLFCLCFQSYYAQLCIFRFIITFVCLTEGFTIVLEMNRSMCNSSTSLRRNLAQTYVRRKGSWSIVFRNGDWGRSLQLQVNYNDHASCSTTWLDLVEICIISYTNVNKRLTWIYLATTKVEKQVCYQFILLEYFFNKGPQSNMWHCLLSSVAEGEVSLGNFLLQGVHMWMFLQEEIWRRLLKNISHASPLVVAKGISLSANKHVLNLTFSHPLVISLPSSTTLFKKVHP